METGLNKDYTTPSDRKMRWGGLLENPVISKVQRSCLDGGRVAGLSRTLKSYPYTSLLDVGCGWGECSTLNKGIYFGLDNSFRKVQFAAHRYQGHIFLVGNATQLPFRSGSFDVAMLIDTSHHLSDQEVLQVLLELKRVSRKYIIISDPIVADNQSRLSCFFYKLDRGGCYRNAGQMKAILDSDKGLVIRDTVFYRTFPGLYLHAAFILGVRQGRHNGG